MASEEESNDCKWVVFQYFTKFHFTYWNQVKPLTFIVKFLTLCLVKTLSVFAGSFYNTVLVIEQKKKKNMKFALFTDYCGAWWKSEPPIFQFLSNGVTVVNTSRYGKGVSDGDDGPCLGTYLLAAFSSYSSGVQRLHMALVAFLFVLKSVF